MAPYEGGISMARQSITLPSVPSSNTQLSATWHRACLEKYLTVRRKIIDTVENWHTAKDVEPELGSVALVREIHPHEIWIFYSRLTRIVPK
jgi:hypothetical protein